MKRFIITICLFAMLIAPLQAGAVSNSQIKDQYIQALTEVIALLVKQVNELTLLLQIQLKAQMIEKEEVKIFEPIIEEEWFEWKRCNYALDIWSKDEQRCIPDYAKIERNKQRAFIR